MAVFQVFRGVALFALMGLFGAAFVLGVYSLAYRVASAQLKSS